MSKSVRTRSTRLLSRPSPYHNSVTLFESDVHGTSSVRRASTRSLKKETVEIEDVVPDQTSPSKNKGKPTARKQKSIQTALDKPHPAPENWREVYDTIKEMRSRIVAPVDTMGCDQAQFKETDPKVRATNLRSCLALMCSRTVDSRHSFL